MFWQMRVFFWRRVPRELNLNEIESAADKFKFFAGAPYCHMPLSRRRLLALAYIEIKTY